MFASAVYIFFLSVLEGNAVRDVRAVILLTVTGGRSGHDGNSG